jgi:hypothetical protein
LNISIKKDVFLKTIDKHTKNSGVVFDKISKSGDGGYSGDIFHAKGYLSLGLAAAALVPSPSSPPRFSSLNPVISIFRVLLL